MQSIPELLTEIPVGETSVEGFPPEPGLPVLNATWPMTMSAAGNFVPAASAAAGKRSARLLPVSATHRFPEESNAIPLRPALLLFVDRVDALRPFRFAVLVASDCCPITRFGNSFAFAGFNGWG